MSPREYVDLIVWPTLADLLIRRDDRRLAYLACLTTYHCVDVIGLAEAARAHGFNALSRRARKHAVDLATVAVRQRMEARCGSIFAVVSGIANGTKHPGRLPLLPGSERRFSVFGFGPDNVGFREGRWTFPGLGLEVDGEVVFLDACAQQALAAFICAYPTHLGGIALSFMDWGLTAPGLDLQQDWVKGIWAWAKLTPSVAEVWLFGSRAKGTSQPTSDVDLALVLAKAEPGHDWPLGDYLARHAQWRTRLEEIVGRHVSLELFGRTPGEETDESDAARAEAVLLWKRPGQAAEQQSPV